MRKTLILIVGALLAGFLLSLAWGSVKKTIAENAVAQSKIAARDTAIARQEKVVARTDTVYIAGRTVYRDVAANPQSTKPEIIKACNAVITSCDARIKASDVLADSLRAQVEAIRKLKAKSPPRFSAFGEAGYDIVHKEPIARAGGEMRVVGPFSLVVAGDASLGLEQSRQRVIVSARFTFR